MLMLELIFEGDMEYELEKRTGLPDVGWHEKIPRSGDLTCSKGLYSSGKEKLVFINHHALLEELIFTYYYLSQTA